MCQCAVCQDIAQFRNHLDAVPEASRAVLDDLYSFLLDVEQDRDYYRAIADGSWPSSAEILARYREPDAPVSQPVVVQVGSMLDEAVLEALPESQRSYFRQLADRVAQTLAERALLENAIHNAVPDANEVLARYRVARPLLCAE